MEPERPAGAPDGAVWDFDKAHWVIADLDNDGRRHGLVTSWRADGTLVQERQYVHGTPHGPYTRYHETGEVSQEGTFENGERHGYLVAYRATGFTTEHEFRADGLADSVWCKETWYERGRGHAPRWYNGDDVRVTMEGTVWPDPPANIPADASYDPWENRWTDQPDFDGQDRRVWRWWDRDGIPVEEREYTPDALVAVRHFLCREDADITIALREGRPTDAAAAARRWWEHAVPEHRVLAGEALASFLEDPDERRELYLAVADAPHADWTLFSRHQRRARDDRSHRAQTAALDWLAEDALAAGRPEDALRFADRAVASEHHFGPCAARVTRVAALRRLGRDDEALRDAREILLSDPDTAGLDDVRADPALADWVASIRADTVTTEGAWAILGERGERLSWVAGWFLREAVAGTDVSSDVAEGPGWPIRALLGDRLSPELDRWIDLTGNPLECAWSHYVPSDTSTVGEEVEHRDAHETARLEGLFLPVSMVSSWQGMILHATWVADARGVSCVFYTDAYDPGFLLTNRSLGAALTHRVISHAEDGDVPMPAEAMCARWLRADALLDEQPEPDWPAHLSVPALYPRTGWIVQRLLAKEHQYGLADAPGIDQWAAEREHAADWPHLQVYWLLHHLVFDNREELGFLVEHAERRYPAVAELAAVAESVLGGGEPAAAWWDPVAGYELRVKAIDSGHARLMTDASVSRLRAALSSRDRAIGESAAARAALLASRAPAAAEIFALWDVLASAAGRLDAVEREWGDRFVPEDERVEFNARHGRFRTSVLSYVLPSLADLVGPAYRPFFDAEVRRGIGFQPDHECSIPGAIVGLGVSMGDFASFRARVEELLGAENIERYRRGELAIVAARNFGQPAARDFLVGEATGFARFLADHEFEEVPKMFEYALAELLALDPALGGRLLSAALVQDDLHTPRVAMATFLLRRAVAAGIPDAVSTAFSLFDAGIGHHEDGSRGQAAAGFVSLAVAAGVVDEVVARLESRLGSLEHTVEKYWRDCERAALLTGLIAAAPDDGRWREQARALLETLLSNPLVGPEGPAMVSLLRTIDAVGVPGFEDVAAEVRERFRDPGGFDGYYGDLEDWLYGEDAEEETA